MSETLSEDHLWITFSLPNNRKGRQISISLIRKGPGSKEQVFENAYMHAHVWVEHGMVLISLPEGTTKEEAVQIPNTLDRTLINELLMGTERGETLEIPYEILGTSEMDECVMQQKEARAQRKALKEKQRARRKSSKIPKRAE